MSNVKLGENCHFVAAVRHVNPKTNDNNVYHFAIMDEDLDVFYLNYYINKISGLLSTEKENFVKTVKDEESGKVFPFMKNKPLFALAKNKFNNLCIVKIEEIYPYKESPYKAISKKLHAPVDYQAAYERRRKAETKQELSQKIRKQIKKFDKKSLLNYMMERDGELRTLYDSYKALTGKEWNGYVWNGSVM